MKALDSNLISSVLSGKVAATFSYWPQENSYNIVSLVTGIKHMGNSGTAAIRYAAKIRNLCRI